MTVQTTIPAESGRPAPFFVLESADGRCVRLWDYKQRRNLLLLFVPEDEPGLLRETAARYREYRELETEVLAVLSLDAEAARALATDLKPPFPLLLDPDGAARRRYLGNERTGLAVIDRFGTLYAAYAAATAGELPGHDELLSWLQYIELQCPE